MLQVMLVLMHQRNTPWSHVPHVRPSQSRPLQGPRTIRKSLRFVVDFVLKAVKKCVIPLMPGTSKREPALTKMAAPDANDDDGRLTIFMPVE